VPVVLLALAGWSAVAILWSPSAVAGLVSITRLLSFVVLVYYAVRLGRTGPAQLVRALWWLTPVVLLQSAAVVVFARRPDLEAAYLSGGARFLIGHQSVRALFTTSPDNVLDPVKAGGLLFLNSNTASMFMGVAACCYLAVAAWAGSRRCYAVAAVLLVAVVATGSKTGVALALLVPVAYVLALAIRRSGLAGALMVLGVAAPVALWLRWQLPVWAPEYVQESGTALQTRSYIWTAGRQLFTEAPVLGLGFGGWGEQFTRFAGPSLSQRYPPHNSLLLAWSETGLVGTALVLAFAVVVLVPLTRAAVRARRPADTRALTLSCAAYVWALAHSMGDATAFFGDVRNLPFLAIALGVLVGLREEAPAPPVAGARGQSASAGQRSKWSMTAEN
jgi:O-antigen ligase